jgi:hypothetical protein
MIEGSSNVIKLRYLLPGLSFLFLALVSLRFARKQTPATEAAVNMIEKGETK